MSGETVIGNVIAWGNDDTFILSNGQIGGIVNRCRVCLRSLALSLLAHMDIRSIAAAKMPIRVIASFDLVKRRWRWLLNR